MPGTIARPSDDTYTEVSVLGTLTSRVVSPAMLVARNNCEPAALLTYMIYLIPGKGEGQPPKTTG